jgi:hypothetical protein
MDGTGDHHVTGGKPSSKHQMSYFYSSADARPIMVMIILVLRKEHKSRTVSGWNQ